MADVTDAASTSAFVLPPGLTPSTETIPPPADAPAGTVPVTAVGTCSWDLFRTVPPMNMRNGDPSEIKSVLVKATIASEYHWVPVQCGELTHHQFLIDGYIKSALAHMYDSFKGTPDHAKLRKRAIVLGTIRAISTSFYRLAETDFISGEVAKPYLSAVITPTGGVIYTPMAGLTDTVRQIIMARLKLSEKESNVIAQLMKCAVGVISMQGYSLLMTNNHDSQSRKVYAVVEKAYWRGPDVADWFQNDSADIQDMAWHKATHPVSLDVKMACAMDPLMPVRISNAGGGACASRLPTKESALRAAGSYQSLFATVNPLFAMFGGEVNTTVFDMMVNAVSAIPHGTNPTFDKNGIPPDYRDRVHDRTTGLLALGEMVKSNADLAAMCFGFYVSLSESNTVLGEGATTATDTLKSSYALSKLKGQSHAAFVTGLEIFKDYQLAVRNKYRMEGKFTAPRITIG